MCLNNVKQMVDKIPNDVLNYDSLQLDQGDIGSLIAKCNYSDVSEVSKFGNLNILHLNIRSLHKNLDNLRELLSTLNKKNVSVDVVLLCETWLNSCNMSMLELDGYKFFAKNRSTCKGGGIGVYVRNAFEAKVSDKLSIMDEGICESLMIEIYLKKQRMIIGEIYRVPGSSTTSFEIHIQELLQSCKGISCFIGSDQNLDLLKHGSHKPTDVFLNKMLSCGLMPTILRPTRVTNTSCTLIDNIYIPMIYSGNYKSDILIEQMSDHFPCLTQINYPKLKTDSVCIVESRKLTDTRVMQMNNDLLHTDWLSLLTLENSVNDNYSLLVEQIKSTMDKHIPLVKKKIHPRNQIHSPWMTPTLLKCSKKCRRLYKESIGLDSNNPKHQKYFKYLKALTALKKVTKTEFYTKEVESFQGNAKKLWSLMNKLIGKQNDKSGIISQLKINNVVTKNPLEICESLNNHFATAGLRVSKKPIVNNYKKYLDNRIEKNFEFLPISEMGIINLIDSLPNKKVVVLMVSIICY